jgi:hypothetical protein
LGIALGRVHAPVEIPRFEIPVAVNESAVGSAAQNEQAKPGNGGADDGEESAHFLPDAAVCTASVERQVIDWSHPPMTFDLCLSESAGSRSLLRLRTAGLIGVRFFM